MVSRACVRAVYAGLGRYPLQTGLAVLGLALGVMVFVAVDIANESARRAFHLSMQALVGNATHSVVGGVEGVSAELYVELRTTTGARNLAPVIETTVRHAGRPLTVLGVDPLAESGFRSYAVSGDIDAGQWRALLTRPGAVLLDTATAARVGLQAGAVLTVTINGRDVELPVVGLFAIDSGLSDLLIMDIASAEVLTGRHGRLSRIDVSDDEAATGVSIQQLREHLPQGARIIAASARVRAGEELTRAFHLNLTAMSLLALVIGMYLIYNTMHFTVLRRRELFGALRALGVSRRELGAILLVEATVLGAVATLVGLLAGIAVADYLLVLVSRTIDDLYFTTSVGAASLSSLSLVKAVTLGLVATWLAAFVPLLEALRSPPRVSLQRHEVERASRRWVPLAGVAGLLVLVMAAVAIATGSGLGSGYFSLACLLVGFSLLTPAATLGGVVLISRMLSRLPVVPRLAVQGITDGLSRTGVAQAALVVTLSATIGVALMIGSFRVAVQDWLESTLRADIYVTPSGGGSGRGEVQLVDGLMEQIAALDAVHEVSSGRYVELLDDEQLLPLFAINMAEESYRSIRLLDVDDGGNQAWRRFRERDAVLVSEPYAYHHGLNVGDALRLPTASGAHAFVIAGVYRDYAADRGIIMMRMSLYRRHWEDPGTSSMGIYLDEGRPVEAVIGQIHALADGRQQLRVRSNRELRRRSLEVFDRTFEITRVLRWLTIVVAVVGILTAFSALQLERGREFAVLRSIGMTPRQLLVLLSAQTTVLGLLAGLFAIPVGTLLSLLLIHVINRRAFGWSMDFVMSLQPVWQALALAAAVAFVAGLYPAWRAAAVAPARALHAD